mgnify:CR=1 FL=1
MKASSPWNQVRETFQAKSAARASAARSVSRRARGDGLAADPAADMGAAEGTP